MRATSTAAILMVLALTALVANAPAADKKPPQTYAVEVITDPAQAQLFIDMKPAGATPATVQLAAGTHLVAAEKDGYLKSTTSMEVRPGNARHLVEIKLDPIMALVLIRSTPPGADVEVGDVHRGKTPLLVTDLRPGEYRVKVSKQGCLSREKMLKVPDRRPVRLDVDLVSDSATLVVDSEPAEAEVLVNGFPRGKTPCEITDVIPGESKVAVVLAGYEPFERTVPLSSGERFPLRAVLHPKPGSLVINSIPDKAFVYVNNQRRGTTPLTVEGLSPGEYRVRVEMPGYAPLARTLTLEMGGQVSEEFRLEKNSGMLQITSRPAGVQVVIDGQPSGETKATPEAPTVSVPLIVDLLPLGTHTVLFTKKGYEDKTEQITIEQDKTTALTPELKKLFIPDTMVRIGSESQDIYTGVLVQRYPNGDVQLEIRPRVFRRFGAAEIKEIKSLIEE